VLAGAANPPGMPLADQCAGGLASSSGGEASWTHSNYFSPPGAVSASSSEYRSDRFYRPVNGAPRVMMLDGLAQGREMRAEQMSGEDLDHLLRKSGYRRHRYPEVKMGLFEVDSHLSVLLPGIR
jgi:hypothetical protein